MFLGPTTESESLELAVDPIHAAWSLPVSGSAWLLFLQHEKLRLTVVQTEGAALIRQERVRA